MTNTELDVAIQKHLEYLFHEGAPNEYPEPGKRLEIGEEGFITEFGENHKFKDQDLEGAIFENCRFNNVDFSGVKTNLSRAEFHQCAFFNCNFHYTNMENIWLEKCSGSSLDMREATLLNATLDDFRVFEVDFANIYAEGLTITNGRLDSCKFTWAKLRNGTFQNLVITHSQSHHTYFDGSTFTKCRLFNNDFECADIADCIFQNTVLSRNNFHKALFFNTKLVKCEFPNNNLLKADLEGVQLMETPFDLSTFPLWCGSFGMKPDDRLVAQLIYHVMRFGTDNMSDAVKKQLAEIRGMPIAKIFPEKYRNDIEDDDNA